MRKAPGFDWLYRSVVVCLLAPLGLIVMMSVKDGAFVGFPIGHVTLRWYGVVVADPAFRNALFYSCLVAIASTTVALVIGTWTALAIGAVRGCAARVILMAGASIPLVTPGIVSGIALRMFAATVDLEPGILAVTLAHAVHAAPYVTLIAYLRLTTMPTNLTEAARNLGASATCVFLSVTLPWLRPALAAAAALAVVESFDDFLRSYFLGGYQPTLPVLVYGRLFSGLSPGIAALTTMMLAGTVTVGIIGQWLLARTGRD